MEQNDNLIIPIRHVQFSNLPSKKIQSKSYISILREKICDSNGNFRVYIIIPYISNLGLIDDVQDILNVTSHKDQAPSPELMVEELKVMIGEQNGLKFTDKGIMIKVPPSAYHLDYNISVSPSDIKFLENIPEGDHIMSIDLHKIDVLMKIWDGIDIQHNMTILNYGLKDMTLSNQR